MSTYTQPRSPRFFDSLDLSTLLKSPPFGGEGYNDEGSALVNVSADGVSLDTIWSEVNRALSAWNAERGAITSLLSYATTNTALFERLDLKKFYALDIPRSYLLASEDTALPPGEWGWHPRMTARLGLYRLVRMPGGHELLFTKPEGLAEKIIEAGRD